MKVDILNSSEITQSKDEQNGTLTFSHKFQLSDGRKISTNLTYNFKDIKNVEEFKKRLLPTIKKMVEVSIAYGLGEKADKMILEEKKLSRFKDNSEVDHKVYSDIDTFLATKKQKLETKQNINPKENRKERLYLIDKIEKFAKSDSEAEASKSSSSSKLRPDETSSGVSPESSPDSQSEAATAKLKKRVTFSEDVKKSTSEFKSIGLGYENIHTSLRKMSKLSAGKINWSRFDKLKKEFANFVRSAEEIHVREENSPSFKNSHLYTWKENKKRTLELIALIESKKTARS